VRPVAAPWAWRRARSQRGSEGLFEQSRYSPPTVGRCGPRQKRIAECRPAGGATSDTGWDDLVHAPSAHLPFTERRLNMSSWRVRFARAGLGFQLLQRLGGSPRARFGSDAAAQMHHDRREMLLKIRARRRGKLATEFQLLPWPNCDSRAAAGEVREHGETKPAIMADVIEKRRPERKTQASIRSLLPVQAPFELAETGLSLPKSAL